MDILMQTHSLIARKRWREKIQGRRLGIGDCVGRQIIKRHIAATGRCGHR